jgi:uncharacterized delta-60 repeat protein
MKKIFTIINILFILTNLYPQFTQDWIKWYNGPGNDVDWPRALVVDISGNIYVTGQSIGGGNNGFDYLTIKYSPSGTPLWIQRYNGYTLSGNNWDYGNAITLDGTGNVYVTGQSRYGMETYMNDIVTIKYSNSGIVQWQVRFDGPVSRSDAGFAIKMDGTGNIYVAGSSEGAGTSYDFVVVKYNPQGVQQWVTRYNSPGNGVDIARALAVDNAGNSYVTGESGPIGNYDFATLKINTNGAIEWAAKYNGDANMNDFPLALCIDNMGNVYVTGQCLPTETNYDYITLKYNNSGTLLWLARYDGPVNGNDAARAITVDNAGNVYVTGPSSGNGTGKDYLTIKYNSSGDSVWVKRYNGPINADDYANTIALDNYGNVYVSGGCNAIQSQSHDYCTIKYSNDGVELWAAIYDDPVHRGDVVYAMAVDTSGKVYVTGQGTQNLQQSSDYLTIQYSQPIGIKPISNNVPDKFDLYQNYPNPFNPVTKIKFSISPLPGGVSRWTSGRGELVRLIIYDILGREIATLVNEQLKPGIYEVEFDGTNYPSGIYYYRITASDFSSTKKLVLLK